MFIKKWDFDHIFKTDVLVIGGGAAGIRAAIEAKRQNLDVMIISPFKVGYGNNSAISYGGISATDRDVKRQDSPEKHFQDTLKGGENLGSPFLVRILAERAWSEVEELEKIGVRFNKGPGEEYPRNDRGGHSVPRRLGTYNYSGMALLSPLLKYAQKLNISIINGMKALSLLRENCQVCGSILINEEGKLFAVSAKSIILATGGGGALYRKTTNVLSATGDGYALAYEAGLILQDMEFVQFILRHIAEPGIPARLAPVEQLLINGAILTNSNGEDLLDKWKYKNYTRDTISIAIEKELIQKETSKEFAYLNLANILKILPFTLQSKNNLVKVYPAAHFFMGGIRVDKSLNTSLAGLFVAGEAMGGIHGANRLGGNALAEAVVFGSFAGRLAAAFAKYSGGKSLFQSDVATRGIEALIEKIGFKKEVDLTGWKREIKCIMQECAGVIRVREKIEQGLERVAALAQSIAFSIGKSKNLWPILTLKNQILLAEIVMKSALLREESRGAHYREDFPQIDNAYWRKNILVKEKTGFWMESVS